MLLIVVAAIAICCMLFETITEAWETRGWPEKSFGGLLLACGLFVGCIVVFT
jgi:hypothetical protein